MHIVIVTAAMRAGGSERVIAQLLKEWSNNGVDCTLIMLLKEPIFYDIPESVNVIKIGEVHNNHYIDKLKKYQRVREIVKSIKPDVVLSLPEEIGVYVIGALLGTKIPVVVSERNNPWVMPNKKPTRAFRRLLYPFADGFVFQTKQAASFFSEKIQNKGIVLKNPLDVSRIPAPYDGEREKIIVGAGRLEKQKNFPLLIDAFAKFYESHQDYKLIIYGDGSLKESLETYARTRLPETAFSFPGKASDLPNRVNRARAFVLSSDYEGVPNVLIEAMAMGVPSVATDCAPGGAADLITDGVNGFITPVGDVDALAEKIIEVVDNKSISDRFSSESVKIVKQLDAVIVCREWQKYLESVIGGGNLNENSDKQ